MYVNEKWYLLKLIHEWREDEGEQWRGWIQVWRIWYCKNFCKCPNVPPLNPTIIYIYIYMYIYIYIYTYIYVYIYVYIYIYSPYSLVFSLELFVLLQRWNTYLPPFSLSYSLESKILILQTILLLSESLAIRPSSGSKCSCTLKENDIIKRNGKINSFTV
jgi:hypothetical protein